LFQKRLTTAFFERDVLDVAPELLGKILVRNLPDAGEKRYVITEVEAYRGEDDLACHASKGRTPRTEIMYWPGGFVYVYLIYGMHYLLNFVTAKTDNPQAVLIRGVDKVIGPGRVSRLLQITKDLNKTSLLDSEEIWVEDAPRVKNFQTAPRVGIDYAGDLWKNKPWRFSIK
jgi:DNA-3-methyladenine glycosylase